MVVTAIGATLVARTISNAGTVSHSQHFSGGLAGADAGVSDALFQIDQFSSTNPAPAEFCVGASSSCGSSSLPAAPGVQYKAVENSSNSWTVESEGKVNGVLHAVQATVSRSVEYPFALFGNQGLNFNGNAQNAFALYDSAQVANANNPNPNGAVAIGSNGTINCHGGISSNVTTVYYTGGGGVSGCTNTQPSPSLYSVPAPDTPPSYQSCPNGGSLGSGASPAYPSIAPGTYLCTGPVTVNGNLSVSPSGVVKLYIILPSSSNTSTTTDLDITANSNVNIPSTPYLPVAADLQILTNGIGNVGDSSGQGYTFGGVIYAPDAYLIGNGCKSVYYGALVINTFTCNGGPHLTVNYDSELSQTMTAWTVSGYTEIPSSSFSIP